MKTLIKTMSRSPLAAVIAILLSLTLSRLVAAEERTLFEQRSQFNKILVTEDAEGLRILRFERGGARQSVVKLGDPEHLELAYARVIPIGLALVDDPKRVLVVGLGGGTIPGLLRKHYPDLIIDAVELDPEVVRVARKYFGFREDAAMRAYAEDGRHFIEQRRDLYDVIYLDAFDAENVPYQLATREFLVSVRRALRPRGVVVGNLWSRFTNPLYDSMVRTYEDVFDQVYIVDVRGAGNKLVLGLPGQQRVARDELLQRAGDLSKRLQLRYELGSLVERGLRTSDEDRQGGRVLLDDDSPNNSAEHFPARKQ